MLARLAAAKRRALLCRALPRLGRAVRMASNAAPFCSALTDELLAACLAIPKSCLASQSPPFKDLIGDPQLFLAINHVVQAAELDGHQFFVLGPGRGTTATHEAARAASAGRTLIHFEQKYKDGMFRGNSLQALKFVSAHHAFLTYYRQRAWPLMMSTSPLVAPLTSSLKALLATENVTGLFDSPWVNYFTELYLAMCPRGVRVIFTTRDSLAWAASRREHHSQGSLDASHYSTHGRRLSDTGFICPFAQEPAVLDPFSLTHCARFARHRLGPVANATAQTVLPHRLPGNAALDNGDVAEPALASAFEKYNAYVRRLVPHDGLLEVDFFSSSQMHPVLGSTSAHAEWGSLETKRIRTFLREAV